MLSVQRHYSLLNCCPTIFLLVVVADKFTASDVQMTNYSLVYQSWLSLSWSVKASYSLLDLSELAIHSWCERWLMLSLERWPLLYRSLLFSLLCHWLADLVGMTCRTIILGWGAVIESGAWFGAGSRDWSYRGREIGGKERESTAVLCGGEIVSVWFGAWIWDEREGSREERWRTEQRRELCWYVGVPTSFNITKLLCMSNSKVLWNI